MEVNILFYLKKILFLIILGVKNISESTSDIFNVLILFIILDYISGIFRAIVEQKLSSQIGYKGILRKIFILVIISVSYLIDEYIIMAETKSMTLIVTMFYISNEGISILENANKIGIPIPNKLKQVLLSVRNEENEFKKIILRNNECYKVGKFFKPKGIMIHSTGVNNPWLKRYIGPDDGMIGINKYNNHWNQYRPDGRQVCVHAFIGKLDNGSTAV